MAGEPPNGGDARTDGGDGPGDDGEKDEEDLEAEAVDLDDAALDDVDPGDADVDLGVELNAQQVETDDEGAGSNDGGGTIGERDTETVETESELADVEAVETDDEIELDDDVDLDDDVELDDDLELDEDVELDDDLELDEGLELDDDIDLDDIDLDDIGLDDDLGLDDDDLNVNLGDGELGGQRRFIPDLGLDPRARRFGTYAGGLTGVVLAALLFASPWRPFEIAVSEGLVPVAFQSGNAGALAVAPVVVGVLGMLTGVAYRTTGDRRPDEGVRDLVTQFVGVQLVAATALYALYLVGNAARLLFGGSPVEALVTLGVSVGYLVGFAVVGLVALAVAVGIPAFVGVSAGDRLGTRIG